MHLCDCRCEASNQRSEQFQPDLRLEARVTPLTEVTKTRHNTNSIHAKDRRKQPSRVTALSTRKSFFSASFHNGSSRVPPTVCGTPAKAFLGSRTERLSPQMRFMVHELPFRQAAVTVLRKRKTAG